MCCVFSWCIIINFSCFQLRSKLLQLSKHGFRLLEEKKKQKTWCQNHIWKYVEPVSSMETCHTLTTCKMTTVCNLLDFSTNAWRLNESSQSLNHQRLDIKRHDEVWWGESEGRKTEGPNLSQMEFQNPAHLTLKLNGLGINRSVL